MNRRAFFSILAAGLAAAIDPERLLWTPGKRLISIPAPPKPTATMTINGWSGGVPLEIGDTFTIAIETGPPYQTVREAYVVKAVHFSEGGAVMELSRPIRPGRRRLRRLS